MAGNSLSQRNALAWLWLAVFVIAHQIDGNIISPLVMARAVRLHPAVVAIGVILVEQIFGFLGLIVAVPIISATMILVEELWVRPNEERDRATVASVAPSRIAAGS